MGTKEFYRNEMRYSSWGKMVVSKEQRKYGKNAKYSHPVLCFEYSVAKWWFYASAVNSGEEPSAMLLLLPCLAGHEGPAYRGLPPRILEKDRGRSSSPGPSFAAWTFLPEFQSSLDIYCTDYVNYFTLHDQPVCQAPC